MEIYTVVDIPSYIRENWSTCKLGLVMCKVIKENKTWYNIYIIRYRGPYKGKKYLIISSASFTCAEAIAKTWTFILEEKARTAEIKKDSLMLYTNTRDYTIPLYEEESTEFKKTEPQISFKC